MSMDSQSAKAWQLELVVDEQEDRTRAKVRMHWRGTELVGVGLARRNPADEPVADIGDELAAARALHDLANQLFVTSESDIEASTHAPVTGLHH